MKILTLLAVPCLSLFGLAQTSAPVASALVWMMQDSGVTASLRGIHSVDGKIVWASGSGGTVLRTVDGGEHWTKCEVPDEKKDGSKLDFRGVQGWDEKTAIVMSSGPGELSRLYKTKDGCKTWKLLFKNPDKDGFWDAFKIGEYNEGWLLGDPVNDKFTLFYTYDGGKFWTRMNNKGLDADAKTQGAFAASNSSFFLDEPFLFVTGGKDGASIYFESETVICIHCDGEDEFNMRRKYRWSRNKIPIGNQQDGSGAFSIGARSEFNQYQNIKSNYVVVGGDYTRPNESSGTAAWSSGSVKKWTASEKPPHGYRSTVQWSDALKVWITAGTNGSDVSRDDGKTWTPLDDGNWNALSLPFIVGPNGRIGRLNESAIAH